MGLRMIRFRAAGFELGVWGCGFNTASSQDFKGPKDPYLCTQLSCESERFSPWASSSCLEVVSKVVTTSGGDIRV